MPRDIPFPDYAAGDFIQGADMRRLVQSVNNHTSASSGPGLHSSFSSIGTFAKLENPTPFIYAKLIQRVEVEETPFSEAGSGSGSGTNACQDSGSGSGSGQSGCQPPTTILYRYTWRQMFEQDGRLYDPVGDTQNFFPGYAGSADTVNEPQYYWPAYEINNREVDPGTVVQLYFGWGNWLYFNVGGHGTGGPAYIDVITNICPIFEEVEPAIGVVRIDTANGISGGPITATGTVQLEDTIASSGAKLNGVSQGSAFQTTDGSLRLWVNNQGRITQIQQVANAAPKGAGVLDFQLPATGVGQSFTLLELRGPCWETFEVRSAARAATLEVRCLETAGFLGMSGYVALSDDAQEIFQVRFDPLKEIPILCYTPPLEEDLRITITTDSRCRHPDWFVAPTAAEGLPLRTGISPNHPGCTWRTS